MTAETAAAGRTTVWDLFHEQARRAPGAVALSGAQGERRYGELDRRVLRLADALARRGVGHGDRIALISENRFEYVEIELAAAYLGAIVACQNWRLTPEELRHCIALAAPALVIASARHMPLFRQTGLVLPALVIEEDYETALTLAEPGAARPPVDPEDGLVILYTSGTTGLPKGALISQRAELARACVYRMDLHAAAEDGFVAWAPLFHMGSTDATLTCLMSGATVHVIDGFDARAIVDVIAKHPIGWLILMPGAIEPVVDILRQERTQVLSVRAVGAMIDLVPIDLAADLSRLVGAPYLNSFGSTETGLPPFTAALIPPGVAPSRLSKQQSSMVEVRLLDSDGRDVPDGAPGEAAVRGPTLFSGYWNAPETNARDFAGGWFRMGDMFVRNADGSFDFVDRAKYLIKTGGENVYPAEIERVLLADPRVRDAVVVRRRDPHWGETPVAVVVRKDEALTTADIDALCREHLASYKRPREVRFVDFDDLPRSTTGKILRHEVEASIDGRRKA